MKNLRFLTHAVLAAALAAVLLAPSASAQDRDWTGFYAGGGLSAGMSTGQVDDPDCFNCALDQYSERLLQVGVNGGYNKQFEDALIGAEAEVNLGSQNHRNKIGQNESGGFFPQDSVAKITWTGAVLARVGLAERNALFFLDAGPALARLTATANSQTKKFESRTWQPGFKYGVGAEFMITSRISLRAQYSVLTVADRTVFASPPTSANSNSRMVFGGKQSAATLGAEWHF